MGGVFVTSPCIVLETTLQILYEDTRQQRGKHEAKNLWWAAHGVTVVRKKLEFGDYMTNTSNVSVDTKRNIQEVAMDCGKDHARFVREMERARDAGYRLVVLTEVGGGYHGIADVVRWTNDVCKRCANHRRGACDPMRDRCARFKRKPMTGVTLSRIMGTLEAEHSCRFEFVQPSMAGKAVCDLLGVRYG